MQQGMGTVLKIWTSVINMIDSTQEAANRERAEAQRESKKRENGKTNSETAEHMK